MDFGLLYEMQVPRPWDEGSEHTAFWNALREVVEAEKQGFTHVWGVEHHFLEEFSHLSAPEVWLTAVAQHTERIRVGHGVIPLAFNHPVRVAERVATLDLMSNGRVELGVGRSITEEELGGFNVDPADTRPLLLEGVDLLRRIWTAGDTPVEYKGKYTQLAHRKVFPKPLQTPHPPLWMACTSPPSYELAGQLGTGVLAFGMAINPEAMGRRISVYREALAKSEVVGAKNDRVAVFLMTFCAETDEEARRIAEGPFARYIDVSIETFAQWSRQPNPPAGYEWYAEVSRNSEEMAKRAKIDYLLENNMLLCGSPETIRRTISMFADAGADQIIMGTTIWGISHEDVLSSLRLCGEQVIPAFSERALAH